MAQFLLSVLADGSEADTPEVAAAIDVFNDQLVADGHWVFAGGLAAPADAVVIDGRGGNSLLTDGPFVETKEHVAGFWIIEAPDEEVARRLATRGSERCDRRVELRAFLEP